MDDYHVMLSNKINLHKDQLMYQNPDDEQAAPVEDDAVKYWALAGVGEGDITIRTGWVEWCQSVQKINHIPTEL